MFRTIGTEGILRLMSKLNKRNAFFESVVAFCGPQCRQPRCFVGKIGGRITRQATGPQGFGFDPIFRPGKSGKRKTFGEMSTVEKNEYSHRADSLRKFAEWYVSKL